MKEFSIEKRIPDRPHAMFLWLFKTFALSAGMYASQIWSTQFLKHDNVFSNHLQVAHMAFLKRILGIKSTSANWCVLRNARRNPCNFTGSGQLSNFGTGWLLQTAILYAMC